MKRLLFIVDEHYPYTIKLVTDYDNPKKRTPFHNFLKDFDPHIIVQGGDQLDLGVIAHWNKGRPRLKEGQRLKKEYEGYSRVLDERGKYTKSLQRHIMLEGNHERWIDNLLDEQPEFEGMLEVENNLQLQERGIEWVKSRRHVKIGHAYFIHGDYKDGYLPVNTPKAIAGIYGKSVFYGHQHKNQTDSMQTPFDQKPMQVTGVGCLCNLNPLWKRDQPSAWTNSFAVMYFDEKDNYHHHVINIVNNSFVFDGQLYK
jgi:hypothetical protein